MKVEGVTEELQRAAWRDLREFLDIAKARGELVVVKGADPHLEMGALYELSLRKTYPPVLLFEDIK
jgi:3-polyprenyl-4-hydroxybenzoate decarboxylase